MGGFAMQLVQAADICTPCVYRVDCVPLNPIVASVLSVIPYTRALAWYFWDHLPPPKTLHTLSAPVSPNSEPNLLGSRSLRAVSRPWPGNSMWSDEQLQTASAMSQGSLVITVPSMF